MKCYQIKQKCKNLKKYETIAFFSSFLAHSCIKRVNILFFDKV